ncbi:MAG: chromosome segregation protein SMC [Polyangiales bacterium]
MANEGAHAAQQPNPGFDAWLLDRPRWLQSAAASLLENQRRLEPKEIADLADLAMAEVSGSQAVFKQVAPGSFDTPVAMPQVRVVELSAIDGVNALPAGARLAFGACSLAVVYGPNGSGKSSFARLLKQLCGSSTRTEILADVFGDSAPAPSATVRLLRDGTESDVPWTPASGVVPHLRHVHVFDGRTAQAYVTSNTQATYEPRRMRFVSRLVEVCDAVSEALGLRRTQLSTTLPVLPPNLDTTPTGDFLRKLKATTKDDAVIAACTITVAEIAERLALEVALKEKDLPSQLAAVLVEQRRLESVRSAMQVLREGFSDAKMIALRQLRLDSHAKREAATVAAGDVLKSSSLAGVGERAWLELWAAAKSYSESHAYVGRAFPVTDGDGRCVLCQQPYSGEAAKRMSEFDRHVLGTVEAAAKQAEVALDAAIKSFPAVPIATDWSTFADFLGVGTDEASTILDSLQGRRRMVDHTEDADPTPLAWKPIDDGVNSVMLNLKARHEVLVQLGVADKRAALEERLKVLQAREWLAPQLENVRSEVRRLVSDGVLAKAIALTKTNALTTKKNELADEELARGYQERFRRELELLGGKRIRVEPAPVKEGKGKVSFNVVLKGAQRAAAAGLVLSDGEQRVVALAAFLADIAGNGYPTPFVFDDPISSLDQDFEERVVARLVELARTRQVIVFTHRLSLTTLLDEAVTGATKLVKPMGKVAPLTIGNQTLRRLGTDIGFVGILSVHDASPKDACTKILDPKTGSAAEVKRLFAAKDIDGFNRAMKAACSDFRILIERTVEKVLVGDIVSRFRRSIQTLGRIGTLAKVSHRDCEYIDDLMTKYSCFEHSQSDEVSTWLPEPDEFNTDVTALLTWIRDFEKRVASGP